MTPIPIFFKNFLQRYKKNTTFANYFENLLKFMLSEEQIMSPDELEQVEYMWNLIPNQDRTGMTKGDILFVLDVMDDFLADKGLLVFDEATGDATYLDGDIDETEQLDYIRKAVKEDGRTLTDVQIQLIMDAEIQYGVAQGYYEEED